MVFREVNRKKRIKWFKGRRGRTVDDYRKNEYFQMKVRLCSVQTTVFTFGEKTMKSTTYIVFVLALNGR